VLPLLVGESDLVAANALNSLSENLTRLTAPALGGALFGLLGLASVVWVDSASFLASGALISLIAFPARATTAEAAARGRVWVAVAHEWREGMTLMRNDATITAIFAAASTAMIAEGFILVLLVPFVTDVLHSGSQGFGWLMSAEAIGGLVGSAFLGRASSALRPSLLIPLCGAPFGLLDIALANLPGRGGLPTLPVALVLICLAGAPLIGFYIGMQTVLQTSVPDRFRGRVFGAYATTVAFATLVGEGVGSLVGDRLGIVPAFTIAGAFELLAALVAFILLGRAHRATHTAEPLILPEEAMPTA
jgi:predicted MFS family arabinose efflux permease